MLLYMGSRVLFSLRISAGLRVTHQLEVGMTCVCHGVCDCTTCQLLFTCTVQVNCVLSPEASLPTTSNLVSGQYALYMFVLF